MEQGPDRPQTPPTDPGVGKDTAATTSAAPIVAPSEPSRDTPATTGLSRREVMTVAAAVAGAGVLTLVVLAGRGGAPSASAMASTPAAAPTRPAATEPLPGIAAPKWSGENAARWTGGARRSFAFELPANQHVDVWLRRVRPMLVVRCAAGETDVFVFTDSAAKIEPQTEDHTVRYRFDSDPEIVERWADSSEHDGLFAPMGASFAERLKSAHTMTFGFTPHNASPVTMQFDVSGLRALVEPVEKGCRARR